MLGSLICAMHFTRADGTWDIKRVTEKRFPGTAETKIGCTLSLLGWHRHESDRSIFVRKTKKHMQRYLQFRKQCRVQRFIFAGAVLLNRSTKNASKRNRIRFRLAEKIISNQHFSRMGSECKLPAKNLAAA